MHRSPNRHAAPVNRISEPRERDDPFEGFNLLVRQLPGSLT